MRSMPNTVHCYPFNAQEDPGVPFHWNFNSILRRDHQKNFLWDERRAYESVDEKSDLRLCPKKRRKKEFGP